MPWRLNVLGETSFSDAPKTLRLERKTLGVLTYLALNGSTHRSKLAGLLWPDSDEKTARNNLSQVLRRLKKSTEATLILGEGTETLSLSGDLEVDVATFNVLAFSNDEKIASMSGELLASHDYDDCPDFADWLFVKRESLQTLRQNVFKNLTEKYEKEGNYQMSLRFAESLLHLDTLSEEAHRQVMRGHFLAGDRAAALRAFEKCKGILEKELGVEPSQETRALAAELEFGSLLPTTSKNKTLPLRVLRPPLIGREGLWSEMETAWGNAQPVILRGEAGVGKSRLLKDFLETQGAYVLFEGRPGDKAVAYSTMSKISRQVLALYELRLEPWQRKELSRILPELGETPAPLTSETDQLRFYEAQAGLFQSAFEKGMHTVALDDLQFFDEASFNALLFILGKHWGKPNGLQTLLAFRRGELRGENETALRDMLPPPGVLLDVLPLNSAQVKDLVQSLGLTELEILESTLHGYTGGNPLFMIETMKSVLESGTSKLSTSSKVQTLLKQRLEKLSQGATRLAWTAAIAQTDFSLELAGEVLQQSPFELAEPLLELEQRQIFVGERFSHDLIFETALASIAAPVKTYLHKQTAGYLEKQQANPARIANHYLVANDQNKALTFLEQAAETTKRDFQLVDTTNYYEQIVSILETRGEKSKAFDVLYDAADLLQYFDAGSRMELVEESLFRLAQLPVQKSKASVVRMARLIVLGKYHDALAESDEALARAIEASSPEMQAQALLGKGIAQFYLNNLIEALSSLQEVVKVQPKADDEGVLTAKHSSAVILQRLGKRNEARSTLLLLRESGHEGRFKNLETTIQIASIDYEQGLVRQAVQALQTIQNEVEAIQGNETLYLRHVVAYGKCLQALESYQVAFSLYTRFERRGVNVGNYMAVVAYTHVALLYQTLGDTGKAKEVLSKAFSLSDSDEEAKIILKLTELEVLGDTEVKTKYFTMTLAEIQEGLVAASSSWHLARLLLLQSYLASPKESLSILEKILSLATDKEMCGVEPTALIRMAQALLKLKRYAEALHYSSQAVSFLDYKESALMPRTEIMLTHYQALKACEDTSATAYLKQTFKWLMNLANNHVPNEYRESFLYNNPTNKAILEAARLENLLTSDVASV